VSRGNTEIIGIKNRHGLAKDVTLLSNMGHCNYAGIRNEEY
jgi:hypothetical protein